MIFLPRAFISKSTSMNSLTQL